MSTMTATNSACPYCRTGLEATDDEPIEIVVCEACATPHHADCYAENGGCTVFGCARAPVDEPKISVSSSDLTSQYRPPPPLTLQTARTPPPPRRPGTTTAVPPPPPRGAQPVLRQTVIEDTTRYLTPPRNLSFGGYNAPEPFESILSGQIPRYIKRRSRLNYILLGVFLGSFGAHNFYAGYMKRAAGQLLLTIFVIYAGGAFWGGLVSWVWAIVEVFLVKQDDDGIAFI